MPELPEVETVRRGLQPHLKNHVLEAVRLNRPDLRFPLPVDMRQRLTGARLTALSRRAKFLVAETDRGDRLVMHLGMSGRFTIHEAGKGDDMPGEFTHARLTDPKHDHVEFLTDQGTRIVFNDPRRFGYMQLFTEADDPFAALGPEPLSETFTPELLHDRLKGKKTPLKAALLDQSIVAGLGNIYVCEALHMAKISPWRLGMNMGAARAERLVPAIKAVLEAAIRAGGSTLRDYANADGGLGYFQHSFRVYGREGAPCPNCEKPVQRRVQSGRSTFYCSQCQR